ncbi:MAG: hypothetical protein AAGF74_01680 [Pseudomonadota bacterium]
MSDKMASVDVEDVLSSVRRLVTDTGEHAETGRVPNGRLVLTSDFRVESEDRSEKIVGLEPVPHDQKEPVDSYDGSTGQGSDSASPIEAALETAEPLEEPEGLAEPQAPDFLARDQLAASTLEATIAELEAAVAQGDDTFEPDGSEDEAPFMPPPRLSERTLEEKLLRAEEAEETEEAEEPGQAEEAMPPEPTAHDPIQFVPLPRPVTTEAGRVDEPEDDIVVDEAMLRELIGQILREELQGDLGARITRNVRKLVRREILRVLETNKYD